MSEVLNRIHPNFENTSIAFAQKSNQDLDFSIFIFKLMNNPTMVKWGTSAASLALKLHLPINGIVRKTVFRQFCGGESMEGCNPTIVELGKANIGAILDYSVEGAKDEKALDHTKEEIIRVIEKAKGNPNIPVACMKLTGVGRFELLQKMTESVELNPKEKAEYGRFVMRVEEICMHAYKAGVPIYIDAEESWVQVAIDRITETMMRRFNKEKAIVFTTLQMYRHDKLDHLKKLMAEGAQEGFIPGIKFVRGAYLEKENKRAADMGYPTPMQPNKESTDRDYNAATSYCLEHLNQVEICVGTHNEESCMIVVEQMEKHNIPSDHKHIYFSQLYGMSDHISFNLANAGYNVSKYLPYGPVESTMPYLIRRAEENTSIAGQMGKEYRLLLEEKKRRSRK